MLPGGESTTVDKLLDSSGLRTPLRDALRDGMPALAVCAGLIVLVGARWSTAAPTSSRSA